MNGKKIHRREFLARGTGASVAIAETAREQTSPALPAHQVADLVLKNGKLITVNSRSTIEQAVAIRGERILAIGSNAAMGPHIAPGTQVVDLRGRAVIPGLIDGHAHMDREGLKSVFPSLGKVRSIHDIQDRIADLARHAKPGEWIVTMPIGDPPFFLNVPDILAEKRWPNRHDLDAAARHNPVLIRCIWGFWRTTPPLVTCVNTEALRRAAIDRNTLSPDPELVIEKDENGDPTGVFLETEFQPLAELIWFQEPTRFSRADRAHALPLSAQAYHAYGTTSVFEEHGVANEVLRAYKDAAQKRQLTMRTSLVFSPNWKAAGGAPLRSFIEAWAGWLGEPALGDNWLKVSGLYVNIQQRRSDDLRAAAGPYTGWGGYNYDTGLPPERLRELALECARNDIRVIANAGLSPGILDIFE